MLCWKPKKVMLCKEFTRNHLKISVMKIKEQWIVPISSDGYFSCLYLTESGKYYLADNTPVYGFSIHEVTKERANELLLLST